MAETTTSGGGNSFLGAALSGLISGASAVSKGGPKRQYKYNKKLAEDQNKMNRDNTQWILEQNKQLLDEQRKYDSPAEAMARYNAAGLNPHLIYDKGASPSSPIQVGNLPGANLGHVDTSYPDIAGTFLGAQMAQSQMGLTSAKTQESGAKTQSLELQREIAKTNPMLNPEVAAAVSDSMLFTASTKAQEQMLLSTAQPSGNTLVAQRVRMEVEAMAQKLKLNTSDLAIKNKILESKEFDNAIKEIQAKWLKDGEVTPEHIRQGLMLILGKMMN